MKCLTLNAHSFRENLPLKRLFDFPKVHEDNYALYLVNYLKKHGRTYYWSWVYNHISYDEYNEGVAILSKTPFEAQDLLVSNRDDEYDYNTRRVLIATTTIENKTITFVNVHLSQEGTGFEEEWHRLEKALAQKPKPYILLGNFNTATHSKGYQLVINSPLHLQDCHAIAADSRGDFTVLETLSDGNERELMMDHVFVSRDVTVNTSYVSFDGGHSPIVSDHYGLAVDISLED